MEVGDGDGCMYGSDYGVWFGCVGFAILRGQDMYIYVRTCVYTERVATRVGKGVDGIGGEGRGYGWRGSAMMVVCVKKG